MFEKSKLKKKSKYLKKPLELKSNISETLAHNTRADSILKKDPPKPSKIRNHSRRDAKLQDLYNQVELQHHSDSHTDNSEEMLLADLERRDDDDPPQSAPRDQKAALFAHLANGHDHLARKLTLLEQKIDQNIRKYSVEARLKDMSAQARPRQASAAKLRGPEGQAEAVAKPKEGEAAEAGVRKESSLLPRALRGRVARLSEAPESQVRLASMQVTHHSLVRVKEELGRAGRLRVLDLSYNSLTNKSVALLAEMLSQNVIEELSVKWNQLGHEGAAELLEAVTYNINLASLDLSYNKLTTAAPAFLDACLHLLHENKYLTHLNLEMCHIAQPHCAAIAAAYNLHNQSVLALHFAGNSRYFLNKLGYLTRDPRLDLPEADPRNLPEAYPHKPTFSGKHRPAEDCCWLCQHWVGEVFKFPQEVVGSGLLGVEQEYFVHLSCYDFLPIRLTNEQCINTAQFRRDCRRVEWANFEIHLAQIPVPAARDLTYFFTSRGRPLLNPNEPAIEFNQTVTFEVFDLFGELYGAGGQKERYSVFVRQMHTRSKEQLEYNRAKKQREEECQSELKEACRVENQKALKTILSRGKRLSIHSGDFEPLPSIVHAAHSTPTHARTRTTLAPHPQPIVNARRHKERTPATPNSQKYLSLGLVPRNKQFLFNYERFGSRELAVGDGGLEEEVRQVEAEYFGVFKRSEMGELLREREALLRGEGEEPFMDRFKILTRRFFNSQELLFSDIISFIYSTFISLDSPAETREPRNPKNKSVKFKDHKDREGPREGPKDSKLSILSSSEKQLEGKAEATALAQGKGVERRALSMNCISDKYQLSKLKAMPAGSIHTLLSNPPSTDKTIRSLRHLPDSPALPPCFDRLPAPIDLTEDVFARYSTLATRYARHQRVVLELVASLERAPERDRLKEINEIILTHNYYRLTLFYEAAVQQGLEAILLQAPSLAALLTEHPSSPSSAPNNSPSSPPSSAPDAAQLEALEEQIAKESAEEGLASLAGFLGSEEHRLKGVMRREGGVVGSSRKRKGKYGRSLKNIKEELGGEQSKVVLPADSEMLLQEMEFDELSGHHAALVRHLDVLAGAALAVLDQLVRNYLADHSCADERPIVEHWLRAHLGSRLAAVAGGLLGQFRGEGLRGVRERSGAACAQFVGSALVELGRASVMLGSSVLQDNFKEYQFISPFHSYEFILSVEITKLTHITRALQDAPALLRTHLQQVRRLLGLAWRDAELELVRQHRQADAARKVKRIKTITDSLHRQPARPDAPAGRADAPGGRADAPGGRADGRA